MAIEQFEAYQMSHIIKKFTQTQELLKDKKVLLKGLECSSEQTFPVQMLVRMIYK